MRLCKCYPGVCLVTLFMQPQKLLSQVEQGVEPNEHGTWLYGRNGWCDGQDVRPWLADVSADLKAPGAGMNVVEYRGLYRGKDPQPRQNPGYIMQSSTLSFSKTAVLQDSIVPEALPEFL